MCIVHGTLQDATIPYTGPVTKLISKAIELRGSSEVPLKKILSAIINKSS